MPSIYPVLPSDAGVGAATVLQERAAELERVFGSCLGWMAPGVSLRKLPHHQLETNPVRVAARIFHLMARYIATAAAAETGDISLKTKATQECSTWLGEGHCVEAGRSGIWDLRQKSPQKLGSRGSNISFFSLTDFGGWRAKKLAKSPASPKPPLFVS